MEKKLTCINCPMGCLLTVTIENSEVTQVKGNTCKRGETYAQTECTAPVRMVTSLVMTDSGRPISVKTSVPIPKEKIFECLDVISKVTVNFPVKIGDVIVKDVCGTGADVIATKNYG